MMRMRDPYQSVGHVEKCDGAWRGAEGKVELKGRFFSTTTLTRVGFRLK